MVTPESRGGLHGEDEPSGNIWSNNDDDWDGQEPIENVQVFGNTDMQDSAVD